MSAEKIYLDHAATTPVHPDALASMLPSFGYNFGNPSSSYSYGKKALELIEDSRQSVASLIGAKKEEIIFTSGGTESDNLAIKGAALANINKGRHIITCATEHHAVLNSCEWLEKLGFSTSYLPVDKNGLINLKDLKSALNEGTILISIMHANNETGTIQPIEEIGKIAKETGILFHIDAVQSAGKIPVDVRSLDADLLSLSSHKIYGPKGTGALYVKEGTQLQQILSGGAQEKALRAGTENVTGIIGFGKACIAAGRNLEANMLKIKSLRDNLESMLMESFPDCRINGYKELRNPGISSVSFKGLDAQDIVSALDAYGICVSAGAACNSMTVEASHVLSAMKTPPEMIFGTIRFSPGWENTEEEILKTVKILKKIIPEFKDFKKNGNSRVSFLTFETASPVRKAKAFLDVKGIKSIFSAIPGQLRKLDTGNFAIAVHTENKETVIKLLGSIKVKILHAADISGIDRPSLNRRLSEKDRAFWENPH